MAKKSSRSKVVKASRTAVVTRAVPAIEDDERHREAVDDFVTRNRDALNNSIRRSRQEVADGKYSRKSLGDIIAEGRKRHS
jgi:predicted RNase H-like nuclease (RuvC/YqgF family)